MQLPARDPRRRQAGHASILGLGRHASYGKGCSQGISWGTRCQSHEKGTAGRQNNASSHQPLPISLLCLKN